MKRFDFLICYDISDKKRLAQIGKLTEKNAIRIQRSTYLLDNTTKAELLFLIDKMVQIIDPEADDLRIYTITNKGIHLGSAMDLGNPLIF